MYKSDTEKDDVQVMGEPEDLKVFTSDGFNSRSTD